MEQKVEGAIMDDDDGKRRETNGGYLKMKQAVVVGWSLAPLEQNPFFPER